MTAEEDIHEILIERDTVAFVAADWDMVAGDFDEAIFTGYGVEDGLLRLQFPSLAEYRHEWLTQAKALARDDTDAFADDLRAVQTLQRIDINGDKALVVKVFDGEMPDAEGKRQTLAWTTFYFLRHDAGLGRWLITGFVGYLPTGWKPA